MKHKKLASLFMAIAMVLSLAVPAFADTPPANDKTSNTQTTTFEGETSMYDVDITIAATGKIFVNPYGIAVTVAGFEDPVSDQIITAPTFITNNTNVALKASAKITVTPTNITMLDAQSKVNAATADAYIGTFDDKNTESADDDTWTPTADTTDSTKVAPTKYIPKGVFLAFEIAQASDNETAPSWKKADAIPANTADGANAAKGSTMVLASGANTLNDCLKLDAVTEDPNYAAFHFTGLVNAYPRKANGTEADTTKSVSENSVTGASAKNYASGFEDDFWTKSDTISTTVVLTFTPDVAQPTYTDPAAPAANP
jgi:hypothetical protein